MDELIWVMVAIVSLVVFVREKNETNWVVRIVGSVIVGCVITSVATVAIALLAAAVAMI